jgi:hypothetical protein
MQQVNDYNSNGTKREMTPLGASKDNYFFSSESNYKIK